MLKASVNSVMVRLVQSSNKQSLLSLSSTIALAVLSGIEVNKHTTSKDTCDSLSRILIFSINLTNSAELFTVCIVLPTKGDKIFFKNFDSS